MRQSILKLTAGILSFVLGTITAIGWSLVKRSSEPDSTISLSVPFTPEQTLPPDGWTLANDCWVGFYVPPGARKLRAHPIDSCVVAYRSDSQLVHVDVEFLYASKEDESHRRWYSGKDQFHFEKTVIDGRKAEIITYFEVATLGDSDGLDYVAVLFIPQMEKNGSSLSIWISSMTAAQQAEAVKSFYALEIPKPVRK